MRKRLVTRPYCAFWTRESTGAGRRQIGNSRYGAATRLTRITTGVAGKDTIDSVELKVAETGLTGNGGHIAVAEECIGDAVHSEVCVRILHALHSFTGADNPSPATTASSARVVREFGSVDAGFLAGAVS